MESQEEPSKSRNMACGIYFFIEKYFLDQDFTQCKIFHIFLQKRRMFYPWQITWKISPPVPVWCRWAFLCPLSWRSCAASTSMINIARKFSSMVRPPVDNAPVLWGNTSADVILSVVFCSGVRSAGGNVGESFLFDAINQSINQSISESVNRWSIKQSTDGSPAIISQLH